MRGRGVVAAAIGALLLIPATATAADPPPGAQMSINLEYVTRVPRHGPGRGGQVRHGQGQGRAGLTGRFGFKTFDVSDPSEPAAAGLVPAGRPRAEGGYWQNEDMELDTKRKLIIGALDPRHTDLGATTTSPCPPGGGTAIVACKSGFYVISYADPRNLRQVGDFVELPSGHTSSCIQDCKYIWTGGPARNATTSSLARPDPRHEPARAFAFRARRR